MLKGEVSPGWEIKSLIEETYQIIGQIDNVRTKHNLCEANRVVDKIANEAVELEKIIIWEDNFSFHYLEIARNDALSILGF